MIEPYKRENMKIIDKTSSPTTENVPNSNATMAAVTPIRRRRQNHHMMHGQDDEDTVSETSSKIVSDDDDENDNHTLGSDDHDEQHTNGRHHHQNHGQTNQRTKVIKRSPKHRRKKEGIYAELGQDTDDHEIIMEEKDGIMIIVNDHHHNQHYLNDLNHHQLDPVLCSGIELDSEHNNNNPSKVNDFGQTMAGIVGNVLEWYDFAVFGYLSDILGQVFFPPNQSGHKATMESFMVFGSAFIMRPIGGVVLGYIGDTYGRKKALIISIFVMAIPTFVMGCLPTYERVGHIATILLIVIRLLQGLSVGGQLMSSLVFTLENQRRDQWGFYGSFVMAAANCGTLLGGIVGFAIRQSLTKEELIDWGWRIPFLMGIFVSFAGLYLQCHDDDDHLGHHNIIPLSDPGSPPSYNHSTLDHSESNNYDNDGNDDDLHLEIIQTRTTNAFLRAIEPQNLRSLIAASMVPVLWSAGFYLAFVWMAIFMTEFIEHPVPGSFGVNSAALLFSVCLFFPVSGILSDRYGRTIIMKIGGVSMGLLGPLMLMVIGKGHALSAFFAQCVLGICLSLWGGPMCAWLVESFEPHARLTSVSIGYNLAHALVGSSVPAFATWLVDNVNPYAPGIIFTVLAIISLIGLVFVAPPSQTGLEATGRRSITSPMKRYPYNEIEMSSPHVRIDNKNDNDKNVDELI